LLKHSQKFWSRYKRCSVIREDDVCRSSVAENPAGDRVIMHDVSFSPDTPAAVRMRLEYETARLAFLSLDRMTVPLDFEFSADAGRIICPWVAGKTLAEKIATSQITVAATLKIAEDILSVLEKLHEHNLIRRCLRPEEIILDESDGATRAFIGGYGPLMILQGLQDASVARQIAMYSSPEAMGALDEDVRAPADLYSLGILLFECLTGRFPFAAGGVGELVFQHMTAPVPDLTSINPQVPGHLSDIVHRLLQKHPRDRYQSAAGVLYDLRQLETVQDAQYPQCLVLGTMDRRETLIEPAFVGRSGDLALLRFELESVLQGCSHTVLVTAASGLGKSRLLLEASRIAVSQGFRVLRGQGQNQTGLAPLASLRDVLTQCIDVVRHDAPLKAHLRDELSEFARELEAVAPELVTELDLQAHAERKNDLSDRRIAVALATFLRSLGSADRPVLILLDDMHWADDLTLTMLECWHLTNSRHTLLIVGTRPAESTAERLRDSLKCVIKLNLEPLIRADHDKLLESMTGGLPNQILTTVWEMSAGSPFMATAILRGLVEGGVLTPSASGWVVDDRRLQNLQMSGEAAEVMKQRLFRLSDESQHLLAVGSVLGKDFSIEMAADLAEIARERVLELLIEPRRNCLIWERASGSICSFMHDQIREAVLQTLAPAKRAQIHRRAALYLSRREPDRVFDIAIHHDASGYPELAREFAIEAAERARRSHALESAEQQYRIALRSFEARSEEPDFKVLYGLGDVLMLCGCYQEAEPLFERAIKCAASATLRAEVTLKLGELAFKEDRKDRAIELWESSLRSLGGKLPSAWMVPLFTVHEIVVQACHSLLPGWFVGRIATEPSADDRLIWRLHSRLAYAYWFVRSKLDVLHVHLRGMNLAERYQPTAELAQAYSEHAPAMSLIPLSRRGISYGRRSLQIRTEQSDVWGQGQSLHCLAIALYSAAQFEECVDVGRRSVRILERAGDYWEKHIAQYQVAASLYRLGRFTEAAQMAREAYDSGLAVGDFQVCGNIIEVWARATNGDIPPKILQCELERPRADVQGQAHVLLAQGVQLISEGRFEEAVRALDQGIEAARKAGISNAYTSPLFAWKATALRSFLENTAPLTRSPRRAIIRNHRRAARQALLVALRFRNELPHALREYAWAHVFQNRNRRAILLLKKSVHVARLQSAEYEQIQSKLLLQKVRLEMGWPDAEQALENAERRHSAFRNEQLPQRMFSSIALVDRFDSLLESGRKIASAIEPEVIMHTMADAARRLLRSNFCEVISIDEKGQPVVPSEAIRAYILNAIKTSDVITCSGTGTEFRSLIACPIIVRASVTSCLVVGNSEVRDLFGANELRIARYLTTIAGAALENAEGFRSLQALNANLERIVEDRTAVVEARSAELQETADHLRQVQVQLAAARDAAESANRAKSDFLAHMSHEIRTPIGAVLGFTELLLNGPAELLPEQRAHLQRVLSNGNHLHRLLNDLLDLSRIEAGELTVESIECAPYAMLHDILSALQSRAIAKNLKLTLKVNNGIPEKVQTDPTRLRQILTNLIGNAIKFTDAGSVNLIVDTDIDQNQLRIHVQDTGLGIDRAAQKDVFEPFKQADETVARRFGGTGLGLPISRKLARALGGDIELSSEPGYGSTFTVTIATDSLSGVRILDARQAEATLVAPTIEPVQNLNLRGFRILIADDVEANRDFFAHVLRQCQAECCFSENGQEAVETMQRERYDLILMDIQMPVMDGYTATQTLRASGVAVPIIAITANGTEDDQQRCRDAGFTAYVTKPVSMAALLRAVGEQLGLSPEPTVSSGRNASTSAEPGIASVGAQDFLAKGPNELTRRPAITLPVDPVFRDFATRFIRKVSDSLPQLMASIDAADGTTLSGLAHWIKGTGGTVGLPVLTDIGRELQVMAKAEDYSRARLIVLELQAIITKLRCDSECELTV
jgi:signal transduction histidine kinase/CheY-like chemotaxis protein/tetratricopeptide (TPR) repeat protein